MSKKKKPSGPLGSNNGELANTDSDYALAQKVIEAANRLLESYNSTKTKGKPLTLKKYFKQHTDNLVNGVHDSIDSTDPELSAKVYDIINKETSKGQYSHIPSFSSIPSSSTSLSAYSTSSSISSSSSSSFGYSYSGSNTSSSPLSLSSSSSSSSSAMWLDRPLREPNENKYPYPGSETFAARSAGGPESLMLDSYGQTPSALDVGVRYTNENNNLELSQGYTSISLSRPSSGETPLPRLLESKHGSFVSASSSSSSSSSSALFSSDLALSGGRQPLAKQKLLTFEIRRNETLQTGKYTAISQLINLIHYQNPKALLELLKSTNITKALLDRENFVQLLTPLIRTENFELVNYLFSQAPNFDLTPYAADLLFKVINNSSNGKALDTIGLLLTKGISPNTKFNGGKTLLHYSYFFGTSKNKDVVNYGIKLTKLLLSKGADKAIVNDNGETCTEFAKKYKCGGRVPLSLPSSNALIDKPNIAYSKWVLTGEERYLHSAIQGYKKIATPTKKNIGFYESALSTLIKLYGYIDFRKDNSLVDFINTQITTIHKKTNINTEVLFRLYNNLLFLYEAASENFGDIKDFVTINKYISLSIERYTICKKLNPAFDEPPYVVHNIHYHFASIILGSAPRQALEVLSKIPKTFPDQDGIRILKITAYIKLNRINDVISESAEFNDDTLNQLVNAYTHVFNNQPNKILEKVWTIVEMELLSHSEESGLINLRAYFARRIYGDIITCYDPKFAIKYYKNKIAFSDGSNSSSSEEAAYYLFKVYMEQGMTAEALEFLSNNKNHYYKVFIKSGALDLIYFMFIVYEKSGDFKKSNGLLESINKNADIEPSAMWIAMTVNELRLFTLLEAGKYAEAASFLEGNRYLGDAFKEGYIQFIEKNLQEQEVDVQEGDDEEEEGSNSTPEEESSGLRQPPKESEKDRLCFEQIALIIKNEGLYKLPPHTDPKLIHKYFQLKKNYLAKKLISQVQKKESTGWVIKEKGVYTEYIEKDLIPIKPGFYVIVKEGLKLTEEESQSFNQAIGKGILLHRNGGTGIKFIKHNLIEVKINDDLRLYTNTIYKNSVGEYLIIFDRQGNHRDVEREARGSSITVINVAENERVMLNEKYKFLRDKLHTKTPAFDETEKDNVGEDALISRELERFDDNKHTPKQQLHSCQDIDPAEVFRQKCMGEYVDPQDI